MRDLGGTAGPRHIWSHHTRAVCLRARAPAGSPLLPARNSLPFLWKVVKYWNGLSHGYTFQKLKKKWGGVG